MYYDGKGVIKNYTEAIKWYRLAAVRGWGSPQGNSYAQFKLGQMYYDGQGVIQSYEETARWFLKAAKQGYVSAQYNLGWMYYMGTGLVQDYAQAHAWLNLAASQGDDRGAWIRDIVAKKMTPAQIAEAQALAREWAERYNKKIREFIDSPILGEACKN